MTSAIILAAGASTRMGRVKQLIPLGEKLVIQWVVEAALSARVDEVIVVVGHEGAAVTGVLKEYPVTIVDNPRYTLGMSTSLQAGIGAVSKSSDLAALLLGDQPLIKGETIRELITAHQNSGLAITVPLFQGRRGHPMILSRRLFPEVDAIPGDIGGRVLLQRFPDEVNYVPVSDPGTIHDIDTPDDLEYASKMI